MMLSKRSNTCKCTVKAVQQFKLVQYSFAMLGLRITWQLNCSLRMLQTLLYPKAKIIYLSKW